MSQPTRIKVACALQDIGGPGHRVELSAHPVDMSDMDIIKAISSTTKLEDPFVTIQEVELPQPLDSPQEVPN